VHLSSLTKNVDELVAKGLMTLYVEINAKAIGGDESPAVTVVSDDETPAIEED